MWPKPRKSVHRVPSKMAGPVTAEEEAFFGPHIWTAEEERIRNRIAIPLGDMSSADLVEDGIDPETGDLGPDCDRTLPSKIRGGFYFPNRELHAFVRLAEELCPSWFYLGVMQDPRSLIVARVHLSTRLGRVFDSTRSLAAHFANERRLRALALQLPVWLVCSQCGVDTSFMCRCGNQVPLCRRCYNQLGYCRTCIVPQP